MGAISFVRHWLLPAPLNVWLLARAARLRHRRKHPNENNASEAADNQETTERRVAWLWRNLTDVHIQANTSPLAFIAGANTLDRQCAMRVTGVEGDIVFACVKDENTRRNSPS